MRTSRASLTAAAAIAIAIAIGATAVTAETRPARDGDIAIKEELCAARAKASVAAYDLFIARHPKHPLVEVARQERARLAEKR